MWQKYLDTVQEGQDNYQKHVFKPSLESLSFKYHGTDVRRERHSHGKNTKFKSSVLKI